MNRDHETVETMDSVDLEAYRRQGDVKALERLVERHKPSLFGYLVNMTGGQNEAEDVFQEVWIRVMRNPGAFRGGNFGGWLIRIAHNLVIDGYRKRKPDISLDVEDAEGGRPGVDRVVDAGPGPARSVAARDLGEAIAGAVRALPVEQRDVFLMRMESDMSFREIARVQKVSINTALARMQYALTKLRPLLERERQ